ncbi:MAG: LON peptidase substrate-binding domain-containing protein [Candidatus Obscuribacterales bacterium]|nr:LON peptidase substrate-binding domain-containing protein [Candidatus Obscuribacterales bacterium]
MVTSCDERLPLFPLPEVVLFPGSCLPLHIFEPRYREMINTVLEKDGCFGVLLYDPVRKAPADIGCSAQIFDCKRMKDGRMNIMTLGMQRFRVLEYIREKEYLQGYIEWIDDDQIDGALMDTASGVVEVLKDVIRLSGKLADRAIEFPEELPDDPVDLSYWIGSTIYGLTRQQQELLELMDTEKRLQRESEILTKIRKELAARTAIKEAFSRQD